MDAYTLCSLIDEMAATSSRTEKEKILKSFADTELGLFVLKWAYDPFITFGITPSLPGTVSGKLEFRANIMASVLKRLASRDLSGNAAEMEIFEVMEALDKPGARLFYLILSKDLKCGIAEATINSVVPGLVPVFSVMRAHPYEEKKVKAWPMKGEYKLDGQRNTFLCVNDNGGFFTRSGKRVAALDFLVPTVLKVAANAATTDLNAVLTRPGETALNFMLDGEAMMGLFAETGALRRKDVDAEGAELHLYDMMSYDDFDAVGSVGDPLHVRRENLSKFVRIAKQVLAGSPQAETIQIVPQFFLNSDEEVQTFFLKAREKTLASYMARGNKAREAELLKTTIDKATGHPKVLEGAMIKNPNGLYDKRKTYGWMKVKAEETEDLRVVDAFPGEPGTKYENCLGGLIVDRNGVKVRVGGGFTDVERIELWALYQHDLTCKSSPGPNPKLLMRLIEVEFHEVTPDGSLRHPRFVRFRDDKDGEVESKELAA